MKTAPELRKISETSQGRVNNIISDLEPLLIEAAERGNRQLKCYFKISGVDFSTTAFGYINNVELTPILKQVKTRLEQPDLGYRVTWGVDGGPYVPRGLSSYGEDDSEKQVNWVLTILW